MGTHGQTVSGKKLSIIIVSYNTREILKECLSRVKMHSDGIDTEILVVDNASSDGSPDMLRAEFPEVILIVSEKKPRVCGW